MGPCNPNGNRIGTEWERTAQRRSLYPALEEPPGGAERRRCDPAEPEELRRDLAQGDVLEVDAEGDDDDVTGGVEQGQCLQGVRHVLDRRGEPREQNKGHHAGEHPQERLLLRVAERGDEKSHARAGQDEEQEAEGQQPQAPQAGHTEDRAGQDVDGDPDAEGNSGGRQRLSGHYFQGRERRDEQLLERPELPFARDAHARDEQGQHLGQHNQQHRQGEPEVVVVRVEELARLHGQECVGPGEGLPEPAGEAARDGDGVACEPYKGKGNKRK